MTFRKPMNPENLNVLSTIVFASRRLAENITAQFWALAIVWEQLENQQLRKESLLAGQPRVWCLRVEYLGESLVATVGEQLADQQPREQRPRRRHPAAERALATRPRTYPDTTSKQPRHDGTSLSLSVAAPNFRSLNTLHDSGLITILAYEVKRSSIQLLQFVRCF